MGELIPISLPSAQNQSRSGLVASTTLVNCYRESEGPDAKNQFSLVAVNGWSTWATLTGASGGVRRMINLDSELLAVAGRQLYTVMPDQSVTLVGGVVSDGLVTMARNRQSPDPQCVIVSDGLWYIYQGGTLTAGNDPDLESPIYVTQKDGYFVFLALSGKFTISGIDETTIDGLDFATAQTSADQGVALATRGTDLLIFGSRSTEFWINTGAADFPFELQAYRGYGCYSAGSVAEITALIDGRMVDSVVWAATDEHGKFTGVYLLAGYEANKISTYEIDRAIEAETAPEDMRGFSWSENGHVFYTITGTNFSYTFDTVEKTWHTRRSQTYSYWRASCHETFAGLTLFGDNVSDGSGAYIYESDIDTYLAGSDSIQMEVQVPIVHAWPYELSLNRVALDAVTGVGLNSTDDDLANPEVVFDVSRDGGANFGTERHRNVGAQGQTQRRIEWWGCGPIPRQGAVLRFRYSPGVKRIMMGVAVDIERRQA